MGRVKPEKWERFAQEYSVDHNAAQAAIRAGYAASNAKQQGYELLRQPRVMSLVAKHDKEKAEALGIDGQWVLAQAVDTYWAARTGAPKVDRHGEAIVVDGATIYEWQGHVAVKSLELIAKLSGLMAPKRAEIDHRIVFRLELDTPLDEVGVGEGYDMPIPVLEAGD